MHNSFLFTVALLLLFAGCGQKSVIKNDVKAEKLSEMYGDGRHVIHSITFPLEDNALAFSTPLPGLGPIAGGILKLVGDIFASNTNMGEMEMSYTQPIPELPTDILHSVRLKRFFFYMKPREGTRRWLNDWFSRYFLGQGNTTFDFLDKFAVRLSTTEVEAVDEYAPMLLSNIHNENDLNSLMSVFHKDYRSKIVDTESARDLILLKYHKKTKRLDTSEKLYGRIHYLETKNDPALVKDFFLKQAQLRGHYKRILLLEKSLLIELKKDPVSEEIFKNIMSENSDYISDLGVNFIDTCTDRSCLEITVPDVNLVPIAAKGNAIKLDAFLHAASVPESFRLKGFVEFEVKFDPKI